MRTINVNSDDGSGSAIFVYPQVNAYSASNMQHSISPIFVDSQKTKGVNTFDSSMK